MANSTAAGSVHISYRQKTQIYHRLIAELACELCPDSGCVLDLGCGKGTILELIAAIKPSLKLCGADMDPVCIQFTAEAVPKAELKQVAIERELDAAVLGTDWDVCILAHVLEHTPRPLDTLRDAMNLLRPGGYLVLAVPNPVRPLVILNALMQKRYSNPGHVYAWDRSHWINFLENVAGLDVTSYPVDEVRLLPAGFSERWNVVDWGQRKLAKAFPWLSHSNIAVVKKVSGEEDSGGCRQQ